MARPTLEEYLLAKAKQLDRKLTDEEKLLTTDEYHKPEQTRDKKRTDKLEEEARFSLKYSRGRWANMEKAKKFEEALEKVGGDETLLEEKHFG